jgi:hypothetical protein
MKKHCALKLRLAETGISKNARFFFFEKFKISLPKNFELGFFSIFKIFLNLVKFDQVFLQNYGNGISCKHYSSL